MAMLSRERTYRNGAERHFCLEAGKRNWTVSKRGWPDFFCFTPSGPVAVEVKKHTRLGKPQLLRSEQAIVMAELQRLGVRCYVAYDAPDGTVTMERFVFGKHAPPRAVQWMNQQHNGR